jgi:hypothetical protein
MSAAFGNAPLLPVHDLGFQPADSARPERYWRERAVARVLLPQLTQRCRSRAASLNRRGVVGFFAIPQGKHATPWPTSDIPRARPARMSGRQSVALMRFADAVVMAFLSGDNHASLRDGAAGDPTRHRAASHRDHRGSRKPGPA